MTVTYGNVWDALCGNPTDAKDMATKSRLMMRITEKIDDLGWTREMAADILSTTTLTISDLYCGRVGRFAVESLQEMVARLSQE